VNACVRPLIAFLFVVVAPAVTVADPVVPSRGSAAGPSRSAGTPAHGPAAPLPRPPASHPGADAPGRDAAHGASERARLSIEPAGHPFTKLSIENPLGDVKVEGYDGTAVQIESHKFAPDDESLDRLHISLVPNPDGTVSIKTTADGGKEVRSVARSAVRIDLTIRAPHSAHVEAAASSGALEVVNMDAGGDLDTASGPISVRNVQGEVLTHSVSGLTRLVQVFGTVDAQTLASDLDLDSIAGERLFASAHRGRIEGRRVRARDIELVTTDGGIVLEAEAALRGHVLVSALHGDVDVQLRRHGAVMVRAQGTRVDLGAPMRTQPNGWVESSFGQLGPAIDAALVEIRSPHGNVRFAIIESRP
jgi:putative adhesin